MSANDNEKVKVIDLAAALDSANAIDDDDDLRKGLKQRSDLYSSILTDYRESIHATLHDKRVYKVITYIIVAAILLATTVTTLIMFFLCSSLGMVDRLSIIIPLIVSFLTVFIVIPQIITNYLFDKDEEKHMIDLLQILKDIDHDINSSIHRKR